MDNANPNANSGYMNLGSFATNFGSFIKNFTSSVLYGITSNGNLFTLMPTTYSPLLGGICVETHVVQDVSGRIDTLCNKSYNPPMQNSPTYIEEHNILLFASAEERTKTIEMYGSAMKLVKAYAAGMAIMVNANFKAVTCLNTNRDFYMLGSSGITKIPSATESYSKECLRKYKIEPDMLEVNDIFIITTVMKNVNAEGRHEDHTSSDIKIIKRSEQIKGQPLIFENDGLVIFDGKENASKFVSKYSTVSNYMIHKALEATHQIHDEELADMNEQAAKDKHGMVETFGLMGATSVASILTENVIKSYNSDDEDATKNAFKIMGFGALGIGAVIALYKLYRYISDKREQAKKEAERLAKYGNTEE